MVEDVSPSDVVRGQADGSRWTILDVREKWELDTVALDGANWIPMGEIAERCKELDKHSPLAVLCHSGIRSRRVAEYLAAQGFTTVVNIAGGIDAWAEELDPKLPRY